MLRSRPRQKKQLDPEVRDGWTKLMENDLKDSPITEETADGNEAVEWRRLDGCDGFDALTDVVLFFFF